jgi:cytochrome c-type biogenesis protein CcmH
MNIEQDVMCPSCHEPLELAQSPQAVAEKAYIKRLIAQGLTKAQIEANLVSQYGVTVLGRPPAHGFNLTVYILPPALLAGGIVFLLVTLPKWRERSRRAAATPLAAPDPLSPADEQRLNADLARLG